MQTELSANAFRLYGKQTPLGNRQSRGVASRSIGRVPRRIEWDKHIVAVVAAGEKYANQCSVAGTLCERLDQPKTIDSRGECPDAQRTATGPAQKFST